VYPFNALDLAVRYPNPLLVPVINTTFLFIYILFVYICYAKLQLKVT
jgi:hypothetical protein